MEGWAIGVTVGACVVVCLVFCFVVAWYQRKRTRDDMWEASKERMLRLHGTDRGSEPLPAALPFVIHHNHFMGGWLSLIADSRHMAAYNVFKVHLQGVDEVFKGKVQPWSRTYKAACQIYGPGTAPKMVRTAIHAEHRTLYRSMGVERTTKGFLKTVDDLFILLNNGLTPAGDIVFFTYVIMPGGEWRFSHTGSHILRDNLSKHAVHSNASPEVVYAGEFHLSGDTLVLDNSSGTFAPSEEQFPHLKELFERNFPGLNIETWSWKDPRLQKAIDSCPTRRVGKPEEDNCGIEVVVGTEADTAEKASGQEAEPEQEQPVRRRPLSLPAPNLREGSAGGDVPMVPVKNISTQRRLPPAFRSDPLLSEPADKPPTIDPSDL